MTRRLTQRHEELVERIIAGGQYADADEVIDQALRLLDERQRSRELRAKLQIGVDQLHRGEGIPFTSEWSADRVRVVRERAAAGETPHPDVCP
ncbi:MAG: ribbon-helix-helix domain-containing protein [Thermomicrobiales bacterium]